MNHINVYIKVLGNGKVPVYASENSAGCDLFATCDMILRPGETKLMSLDFIIAVEPEIEVQIRPRSGLSLKSYLRIPNSPGTIDSDFRDPIGVILHNTFSHNDLVYRIMAQPSLVKTLKSEYKEILLKDYLTEEGSVDKELLCDLNILSEKIYIDDKGNPYGTIYINKGDRIAQMIFTDFKRANFIPHDNPETLGNNRGGGFGHTGI